MELVIVPAIIFVTILIVLQYENWQLKRTISHQNEVIENYRKTVVQNQTELKLK